MASLENVLILSLVLFTLIFLVWLALSLIARRWKSQFVQGVIRIGLELKGIEKALSRIEREAKRYASTDPKPFGSPARDLHRALAQIQDAHSHHAQQRRQLLRQIPRPHRSRFPQSWFSSWFEFYHCWQLRTEAESLGESTRALQPQVAHAEQLLLGLRGIPFAVSRRCDGLLKVCDEIAQIRKALYGARLHGNTIDKAADDAERLFIGLKDLSAHLYQSTEHLAIKGAIGQSTILAWQTLEEIEEPIRDHSRRFQQWQLQHRRVGQILGVMRTEIDAAQQHLALVPSSLDVRALVARLEQSGIEAKELEDQYLTPTIEIMDVLYNRARQVSATSRDLAKLSDSLRRQLAGLHESLHRNAGLLDRIETKMREAARAQRCPIEWRRYWAKLDHLRRIEESIGPITAHRTPDRLYEQVKMAYQLANEGHRLESSVTEARAHRDELLVLLGRPELATRPMWLIQTEDLHIQASKYAPANWSRECAVSEILNDAKELTKRYQQYVPAHVSQPLPATQLGYRVDGVKKLANDLGVFRNRFQQVVDTLASIQAIEQAARRELETVHQAVNRLINQMKGGMPSLATPLIKHQRKLEKLQDSSHKLMIGLEHRTAGLVIEKARNVDSWADSCHKALWAVLKALQAESQEVEAELRGEVEELQELAPFDRERAMKEATRLLAIERPADLPPTSVAGDSIAAEIAHLVNQMEGILRDRASLYPALEDIRSQIRDRVDDLWETSQEARQEALIKFDELVELKRTSEADWPPLLCSTRQAEGLMGAADRDERQLQNSGGTVSNVLKLLRMLIRSYKNVIDEARAKEKKNKKDWQSLQELLDRIDRWQSQLEAYRAVHREDATVSKAVKARLSQIDKTIAKAKRRYRRNPLSYSQAKKVLQEHWSLAHGDDLPVRGSEQPIRVRDIEAETSA
jgi:hypothetical protein